jgi:D-xylose transport system substrate-binding protein
MLESGVKVIVIQPVNSDRASSLVEEAHKLNVPAIAYDRIINGVELDYYVTHDNFMVGILQAKKSIEHTGGKGLYVILPGEKGHSVANQITSGNLYVLMSYPEIKIIKTGYHPRWSPDEAYKTMREVLKQHKKISAVLANNSGMIRGAIKALSEKGLEKKVFTAGADADLINCQYIVRGIQSMDVLKDIKPLAFKAAEIAVELARGKSPPFNTTIYNGKVDVKTVTVPVQAFDKNSIDEVIIKTGFHTKGEIYTVR